MCERLRCGFKKLAILLVCFFWRLDYSSCSFGEGYGFIVFSLSLKIGPPAIVILIPMGDIFSRKKNATTIDNFLMVPLPHRLIFMLIGYVHGWILFVNFGKVLQVCIYVDRGTKC